MRRFSKKVNIDDPFLLPEEVEDYGNKEISTNASEYKELIKLIKLINSQIPVATIDIKNLALEAQKNNAFNTLNDLENLKGQILDLAVTKYNISKEWLFSKLLNKKADLWPAQAASEDTLSHEHNSLSYNPLQEPDLSVSGPNPTTPLDLVKQEFLVKHSRWSEAVKALRNKFPNLTDEDIASLKMEVKATLSSLKKQAKKKSLNIDKVVQVLNSKEPKVVRVDPIKALIELEDGSIITFNEAVDKALEIDKTGVFSGAEFSTTEFNVNPTLDLGPYSSPQDAGKGHQKSPFPNADWEPANDEEGDEEPYSDIASSLNKKAHCGPCAVIKAEVIKMLADLKYKDESVKSEDLEELAKLSADPSNNSFIQYLSKVIKALPEEHDKEIQKLKNHQLVLEDIQKRIDDGDIIADKPFSKKALLKQSDLSGKTVNQILQSIETQGVVNYNLSADQFVSAEDNNMSMIPDRTKVIENVVDFDEIENFIQSNMDLLQEPNNIFRAMTSNGTVYLGIASINPIKAFSKKELNIVKKADESPLTQEDQNEISAVSCPAYVIALNNYASAAKRGHDKDRSVAFAIDSVKNIERIDEKKLVEFINTYL